ncbi:hypothetical protein C1H46_041571 [Malus baccata]|uniref:Sucrose synthase N-terminal domain-containing protein n=1 Tax=Malus baccata TaxID=106549 RepID=A0A540KF75_MALBA|nr:hypothetical protein C1H46_041571 [Malus baccata]
MENRPKFTRALSLRERVEDTLSDHRNDLVALLSRYLGQGKIILQPHDLIDQLDSVIGEDKTLLQHLSPQHMDTVSTISQSLPIMPQQ